MAARRTPIYISVLNDRFIQRPFSVYLLYTGHFGVSRAKALVCFPNDRSVLDQMPVSCPPSPIASWKSGAAPLRFNCPQNRNASANKPRLIELCRLIGSTWADPHGIILLDSSFLPSLSLSLCLFFCLARKFPSPVGEREYPAVSPRLNSSTIKKLTRFYHSEVC